MEYLTTYYSLEKHLEETIKYNPQFEILNAIWKLNKKNLTSALSNVSQFYPHYSLHEQSHSSTIINNIESFLGEDRIKRLSPTDTWLLLMASFTHDLGMVVFQEVVEDEWGSKNFQEFLQEISDWDDPDMKASGELLLKLQKATKAQSDEGNNDWRDLLTPIRIKNSVTLAVAEYMRRIHHSRSSDILKGIDKVFIDVAKSFYSDQIPNRLLTILAEVAYLHGVGFYDIFSRLDYQANGISNDKIHPRFIAAMLRLGDLLDIDDSRFNSFTEKVFPLPESSKDHKQKHSSVKHFLVTPEAIEITADCASDDVYRLARSWYDWLDKEVQNQSREWSNIAPKGLGGSAPRIPKGKIKVFYKGAQVDESLLNLKFHISNERIFEILEGASLYEKAEFTFIREVIQNAIDASKIQLWKEIEDGTFDLVFREYFDNINLSHEEIIEHIRFPYDIPAPLMQHYMVAISFDWQDNSKNELLITIEDSGTGISDADLIRMTTRVGESKSKPSSYHEMVYRMPFWLKPTGAFGIGLQSVFMVADSFMIQTKSEGEESKEIIFRSAKRGKYSSISGNKPNIKRGTKVYINIPKERFPDVFGSSFPIRTIDGYDYFTDVHNSPHILKIRDYIWDTLGRMSNLKIMFFGEDYSTGYTFEGNYDEVKQVTPNESVITCSLIQGYNTVYFTFFERIIGSQFSLDFNDLYKYPIFLHQLKSNSNEYYVRDVLVDDNIGRFPVLELPKLTWNFLGPESDKLLNISRDKFLPKQIKEYHTIFLDQILPIALELALQKIEVEKDEVIKIYGDERKELTQSYFKLYITCLINRVDVRPPNEELLNNESLPIRLISTLNNGTLKMVDFFSVEDFVLLKYHGPHNEKVARITQQKRFIKSFLDGDENDSFVVWEEGYMSQYFTKNFHIHKIHYAKDGEVLFIRRGLPKEVGVQIASGEDIYLKKLITKQTGERIWAYASNKYSKSIIVERKYPSGYEQLPEFNHHFIISPFRDYEAFQKFKNIVKAKSKEDLEIHIDEDFILEYVNKKLVSWVSENNISGHKKVDGEVVIREYKRLMIDIASQFLGA